MDVPQPAPEPYSEGDHVIVYLGPDDPDREFHGTEAIVVERVEDALDDVTDRPLDQYLYRVKAITSENILPPDFRHSDLVPASE